MSEERRLISFYTPRIQIPIEDIDLESTETALYCLPVQGAEMLVRVAPYLQRVVTFIHSVVTPKTFRGPTSGEMGVIDEIVAETMEGLIMACDFSDITDKMDTQIAILAGLADCICNQAGTSKQDVARLPDMSVYRDDGKATYNTVQDSLAYYTELETGTEACEMAQAFFQYVFEMYTEDLLPYAVATADTLTALIIGTIPFTALAGFLGIPIAILGAMVLALVDWAVSGSVSDFTNWMLTAKQDIVCILSKWLPDKDVATAALRIWINDQTEITVLDKAVLRTVLCSSWHLSWVIKEQQENGTWDNAIQSGYCSTCYDEDDLYWFGYPCASATLLGGCGPNDCIRADYQGYVVIPVFEPAENAKYQFRYRLKGGASGGTFEINVFVYATSQSVYTEQITLDPLEIRNHYFQVDLLQQEYHIRIHAVGGSDVDVFQLLGGALSQ